MKQELEKPYTVEQDEAGCEKCGNGAMWCIVDPDGIALSVSYPDKEDAEELAKELNKAFEFGQILRDIWSKK